MRLLFGRFHEADEIAEVYTDFLNVFPNWSDRSRASLSIAWPPLL